jgi:hypothetical protein
MYIVYISLDNIMSQSLEALKNEGWVVTNW